MVFLVNGMAAVQFSVEETGILNFTVRLPPSKSPEEARCLNATQLGGLGEVCHDRSSEKLR